MSGKFEEDESKDLQTRQVWVLAHCGKCILNTKKKKKRQHIKADFTQASNRQRLHSLPLCTVHLWQIGSSLLLPVSEVLFVPFMSSEGITFPPNVGFDLASKLVRHTAAGSLHSTVGDERSGVCVCWEDEATKRRDEGEHYIKPSCPAIFSWAVCLKQLSILSHYRGFFFTSILRQINE